MNRTLWYRQPAPNWNHALPLGNGRLGAMVFGGVATERLAMNEDSLWFGPRRNRVNPDALAALPRVQDLLRSGQVAEAEDLAVLALAGTPEHPAHYVPVGDLLIDFDGHGEPRRFGQFGEPQAAPFQDYKRELDLENAVCRTEYRLGEVLYRREVLVSAADQVLALRLTVDRPGALRARIHWSRGRYTQSVAHRGGHTLVMTGDPGPEVGFVAAVRGQVRGGTLKAVGEWLVAQGDELILWAAVNTTFRYADPGAVGLEQLDRASALGWDDLVDRHRKEHQRLFSRMDLRLGPSGNPEADLPTDERLARVVAGDSDPDLVELYAQFGRYLLISSSRPGTLPANLQGIWNPDFLPPWGSKYTININTQMNYWPAERANLGECHLVLLDHLERMLPSGREVARTMYGCRGFVAHHNTDLWGDCAPVDQWLPATLWPLGAAWLCLHLWEHWEYSRDRAFLERAYPLLKEAALFQLDFLTTTPDGRLVTNPSVSPENTYILPSGQRGCLCVGPSMDSQILSDLFGACIQAAEVLGVDEAWARDCQAARDRLPRPKVGRNGQLMEWVEDYEEAEPGHRHISHLFALYPSDQITLFETPEWARACRLTLERRLAQGGGHTGWSKAWIINLWARLGDGDQAWQNLEELLRRSTLPNLFDNHPPFQIDGNFGATAGVIEMLIQALRGTVYLLPALPSALPSGWVRGVRAPGGFELDLEWKDCRLVQGTLRSDHGLPCRLAYAGAPLGVFHRDEPWPMTEFEGGVALTTKVGGVYQLLPRP